MNPLFAVFEVSQTGALLIGVSVLCAVFAAYFFYRKDSEIETRRKHAIKCSQILSSMGFVKLPALLTDYAVGDYIRVAHDLELLASELLNPKSLAAEVEQVFLNVLQAKLADPQQRKQLVQDVLTRAAAHGSDPLGDLENKLAALIAAVPADSALPATAAAAAK
jgi:hypothetical protein